MDINQLDNYFNNASKKLKKNNSNFNKYSRIVKLTKLAFPAIAALLIGTLLLYPVINKDVRDFQLDITLPKKGELEKLHITNTTFYVTDKNNKVSNFIASNVDETSPGSKLIKLTKPEGIIPQDDERWINIKAPTGFFNQNKNLLELQKDIDVFYSEGMTLNTTSAFYDFNSARGYGDAPITGQGFLGDFSSQGFEIISQDDILILKGKTSINIKEESLKK
ncbi:MAG: hypothetical protein E7012_04135 [Alphaproteobacteria bacterium]|nr:hypothetical protein [Alphaproteobacteria bacterium]